MLEITPEPKKTHDDNVCMQYACTSSQYATTALMRGSLASPQACGEGLKGASERHLPRCVSHSALIDSRRSVIVSKYKDYGPGVWVYFRWAEYSSSSR